MEQKNVIVFHIGTPKTGTSALQVFLGRNNDLLKQKGWIYPLGKDKNSLIRIWNQRVYGGNGSCLMNEDIFDAAFDEISEYAAQYNVIISSENIWGLEYARMERFFRAIFEHHDNIKVVVYLRRQDELIESLYNQRIKDFSEGSSRILSEFIEDSDLNERVFNYLRKLKFLEKLLGKRLIVRRYTKDIVGDFLSLIKLKLENPEIVSLSAENNAGNLSLGSRLLEIKRVVNGFIDSPLSYRRKFIQLNSGNIVAGRKDFYKVMSPEIRQKILDRYAEDNEEIARRYLDDGKPLFENMNINIPYKEYHATPLEEEMIRVFFSFIHDLEIQINSISFHMFKGDRKLAYFGAGSLCKNCLKTGLYRPDIIIDDKGGREIDGIPVVSFDEIKNWKNYYVIITTFRYLTANTKRLQHNGLEKIRDFEYWDVILDRK